MVRASSVAVATKCEMAAALDFPVVPQEGLWNCDRRGLSDMKMDLNNDTYSNLNLGFALSQERLVEEGIRVQVVALLDKFIKSLMAFGGFVTLGIT